MINVKAVMTDFCWSLLLTLLLLPFLGQDFQTEVELRNKFLIMIIN